MGDSSTEEKDYSVVFNIELDKDIKYLLPAGFHITSMADTYDLYQYCKILWEGFNHELNGEGKYNPRGEELEVGKKEFERPNVDLNLKIAVVAPDGNFAAYCGMWKNPKLA